MAKKRGAAKKDGQRVLFVSLFMIMLAFFILLNSIAVITDERKKEAIESLGGAFGFLKGGMSLYDSHQGNPQPTSPIRTENSRGQFSNKVRELFTGKLGAGVEVTPAPGGKGANVRIKGPGVFQGDSTDLPPQLAQRLRRLAELARESDAGVVVRGHTGLSPDATVEEAWWVSGRRAQNVLKVFHEAGVDVEGMKMGGFGDSQPTGSEATPQGRKRNERVEISLKLDEEAEPEPLFPGNELAPSIAGQQGGNGGEG
jgi:chemotaxis protein MotB